MLPINIEETAKGIEIYGFGIVEYYIRSERGRMIVLRDQEYYVPRLPKYFCIIYPKIICISEGYKGNSISHCSDKHDSYVELNLKEDNPVWQNSKPM